MIATVTIRLVKSGHTRKHTFRGLSQLQCNSLINYVSEMLEDCSDIHATVKVGANTLEPHLR